MQEIGRHTVHALFQQFVNDCSCWMRRNWRKWTICTRTLKHRKLLAMCMCYSVTFYSWNFCVVCIDGCVNLFTSNRQDVLCVIHLAASKHQKVHVRLCLVLVIYGQYVILFQVKVEALQKISRYNWGTSRYVNLNSHRIWSVTNCVFLHCLYLTRVCDVLHNILQCVILTFLRSFLWHFDVHCVPCTATTAAVEGKMSKSLKKLLKKLVVGEAQEQLAVADAKLGNVIKVVFLVT